MKRNKALRIRSGIKKGLSIQQIMDKYNVSKGYVYQIHSNIKKQKSVGVQINKVEEPPFEESPNEVQVGGDHYKSKDIQPWDAIHAWRLGFFSGNVIKYVARHKEKNGVEDLKKARHYLDKLISIIEGETA